MRVVFALHLGILAVTGPGAAAHDGDAFGTENPLLRSMASSQTGTLLEIRHNLRSDYDRGRPLQPGWLRPYLSLAYWEDHSASSQDYRSVAVLKVTPGPIVKVESPGIPRPVEWFRIGDRPKETKLAKGEVPSAWARRKCGYRESIRSGGPAGANEQHFPPPHGPTPGERNMVATVQEPGSARGVGHRDGWPPE